MSAWRIGTVLTVVSVTALFGAAEFRDDFSGDLSKWPGPEVAGVQAVDGVLRLEGIGRAAGLSVPGADWQDFVLRFRMRMVPTPEGDGHTGVRLREDPRNRAGEILIFFRPGYPAFTGSGRTEAAVGPAPGYSATEWHSYRLTVTAGAVEVELDNRVIGTVQGVQNEVGGISFYAYNCVAEYDDLLLSPLTAKEADTPPAWPVDLPPRAAGPEVDPRARQESVPVTLYADSPSPGPWPVVIRVADVSLPEATNPTSLTLLRPDGKPCPTQFDDFDGDGRVSPPDEIVALVELDAGQVETFRLTYSADQVAYGIRRLPDFSVAIKEDGFPRVNGPVYDLEWSEHGAFFFRPKGAPTPAITTRPGDQDHLLLRRWGPLRATVIVAREVPDNGRFTRRMDAYPTHFTMACTLAAADPTRGAFVPPLEALHFDLYSLDQVSALWQRGAEGYVTETDADGPPVQQWFPARHGSLAWDLVYPEGNVLVAHGQSPDYTPGLSLVGKHRYMAQNIAFGWRPPVPIRPDAPHVQTVWITRHDRDPGQFRRLEQRLRRGIHVLVPDRSAVFCRDLARRARLLSEALAVLPGVSDTARAAANEAAQTALPPSHPPTSPLEVEAVRRALAAELALEAIGLGGQAEAIREALGARLATLKGDRELAPARGLLLKAQACVGQAKLDLRLEHPTRGAERLARAAAFVQAAEAYLKDAPQPLLPPLAPAPLFPYVTFSEGVSRTQAEAGFDVGHVWVGWGHHFEDQEAEPEPGVWRYEILDRPFQEAAEAGMRLIPLLNYAPPRWFNQRYSPEKPDPNAPPGSTGDTRLVDPGLLDELPPHSADFADYLTTVAQRHGRDPSVLAWSVRNEPAYYEAGGINGEWMKQAFRNWLRRRYANAAALNANWGTDFPDLESVEPPQRWEENKAAWYDLMTFKAECLAGELKWEADLVTAHSPVKWTGAKFVPACVGPQAARSGYGVDPWISARVQQGVALVDLYLDGLDAAALRTAELHWSAGGVPVISCETGRVTKPPERPFRWHFYPDRMASAYAWMMYQYGLYGTHYWTWAGAEEYGVVDWDGSLSDFALEAALANQEFRAARPLLSNLKPLGDIGYFYPRATFVQGGREELEAYHNLFQALDGLGYHLRLVSHLEATPPLNPPLRKGGAGGVSTVVVPPAPFLERSALALLQSFAENGGHVVFAGTLPEADEYLHSCAEEVWTLVGARPAGTVEGTHVLVKFGQESLRVPNRPPWTRPAGAGTRPAPTARPVAHFADGSPAIVRRQVGKGDVTWIPFGVPAGSGSGVPLDRLPAQWKFAFGDTWPQAPGVAPTSAEGHVNRGLNEKWFAPNFDDSGWEDLPVPGVWEDHGHPDVDGWGWYRCTFQIPPDLRGRRIFLQGDTLDDRAQIYLNGILVKETTTWDEKFEVDLTPHLNPDGDNVLALCILDTCFLGGVRGNVGLVGPDVPSAAAQVLDWTLRSLSVEPRLTGRVAGLVAHVLSGGGVSCLIATNTGSQPVETNLGVRWQTGGTGREGGGNGEIRRNGRGGTGQERDKNPVLLDLLTGRTIPCRREEDRLVVPISLPPAETVVLPLLPGR